jgi:DNA-binding MarR family transcriptional regulator
MGHVGARKLACAKHVRQDGSVTKPAAAPRSRSTPRPAAAPALRALSRDDRDPAIEEVEAALGAIARRINLPRAHERVMARAGLTGIDRASYVTLSRIADHGPLRLSELAMILGVDLSTVSRQVATIERRGFVDRTVDPSDRRAAVVRLSGPGEQVLEQLRAAARGRLTEILAEWTDEERSELARALSRFNEAVERFGDRP